MSRAKRSGDSDCNYDHAPLVRSLDVDGGRVPAGRTSLIPIYAASEAGDRRLYHLDVGDLTPLTGWAEHRRVRAALAAVIRSGRDPVLVFANGQAMRTSTWLQQRMSATRAWRDEA